MRYLPLHLKIPLRRQKDDSLFKSSVQGTQVWIPAPTWSLEITYNSAQENILFLTSVGTACMWCIDIHLGKTSIHIELKQNINKKPSKILECHSLFISALFLSWAHMWYLRKLYMVKNQLWLNKWYDFLVPTLVSSFSHLICYRKLKWLYNFR